MRLSRPVRDLFAINLDETGEFVLGISKEEASDIGWNFELDMYEIIMKCVLGLMRIYRRTSDGITH